MQNPAIQSAAPHFSAQGRLDSDILSSNHLYSKKTRDPGPGQYENVDVQFKSPTTKFSKDKRKGPARRDQFPGPDHYMPHMLQTEKNFYRVPQGKRFKSIGRGFVTPGPGQYENMVLSPGPKKTMLGGTMHPKEDLGNGVPGPATYFTDEESGQLFNHVQGLVMAQPSHIKEEDRKRKKNSDIPVGPWKYTPEFPTHTSSAWMMPKGQRGEIRTKSNRINTPGPGQYVITSQFTKAATNPKFSMGIKTELKNNRSIDQPGPGEYEIGIQNNLIGHTHLIGTGQRSDLGVGKAYLAPGPGQYNVRGNFDGKQMSFGKQRKKTKVKKSYDPGPGSYNLPGTIGNIPKYMLISKQTAASRLKRTKSAKSSIY